jgi:hypothetical protein
MIEKGTKVVCTIEGDDYSREGTVTAIIPGLGMFVDFHKLNEGPRLICASDVVLAEDFTWGD